VVARSTTRHRGSPLARALRGALPLCDLRVKPSAISAHSAIGTEVSKWRDA
jgi:hypothetical protein